MRISEKRKQAIYSAVHDLVMAARVRFAMAASNNVNNAVDGKFIEGVMADLTTNAPDAALRAAEGRK